MRRRLLLQKYKLIMQILLLRRRRRRLQRRRKRFWIRRIYKDRGQKGEYASLIRDLMLHDHAYFFNYFRMSPSCFEDLLSMVAPKIKKNATKMREPIPPAERLCVTLRYLVTGDAQVTIAANYRMSPSVVGRIIGDTSHAIWTALVENGYVKYPSTEEEWKKISKGFYNQWNFPNALGAIDGKHILMQKPHNAGSAFFNYKKFHSIVLFSGL